MGCFMKFSRIVAKRTNKTNENHFFLREIGAGLLFVFLLPYVCACLWGYVGEETDSLGQAAGSEQTEGANRYEVGVLMDWGIWKLPLEEYLVYKLAAVMPDFYEEQALMAQAVLLRTECIKKAREQETENFTVKDSALAKWYGGETDREELEKYRKAVRETQDMYLCYDGEPVLGPYFKVSNGKTRDAGEVWHTEVCPYLSGASSAQDKAAPDFYSTVTISKEEYLNRIRSISDEEYSDEELYEGMEMIYDSAGYVTYVSAGCDGETFRRLFGLNSASFTVERDEGQITFYVTGVGHGFGMSQYGANCKALNGETYREILKDYFKGTELAKIE